VNESAASPGEKEKSAAECREVEWLDAGLAVGGTSNSSDSTGTRSRIDRIDLTDFKNPLNPWPCVGGLVLRNGRATMSAKHPGPLLLRCRRSAITHRQFIADQQQDTTSHVCEKNHWVEA